MSDPERSAKMKSCSTLLVLLLALTACSDAKKIQSDVYRALSRELSVPTEESQKKALYDTLISAAKLDPKSTVLFYDVIPIPVRDSEKAFYDSMIFIRKVTFRSPSGKIYILQDEIYAIAGAPPNRLVRRSVFDTQAKRTILEDFHPNEE